MTPDLEIITPNLRGACVTVDNRLHGLFTLKNRKRDVANNAWLHVRIERQAENGPGGEASQ